MRHVGRPGEGAPARHQRPLVGRLHGDDQVGAVGHHHIGDLRGRQFNKLFALLKAILRYFLS